MFTVEASGSLHHTGWRFRTCAPLWDGFCTDQQTPTSPSYSPLPFLVLTAPIFAPSEPWNCHPTPLPQPKPPQTLAFLRIHLAVPRCLFIFKNGTWSLVKSWLFLKTRGTGVGLPPIKQPKPLAPALLEHKQRQGQTQPRREKPCTKEAAWHLTKPGSLTSGAYTHTPQHTRVTKYLAALERAPGTCPWAQLCFSSFAPGLKGHVKAAVLGRSNKGDCREGRPSNNSPSFSR